MLFEKDPIKLKMHNAVICTDEELRAIDDPLGIHLIIDFYECDLHVLCDVESRLHDISGMIKGSLEGNEIVVLGVNSHYFSKNAISMSFHLAESHLHFHTWPERGYVSFDFFCCSRFSDIQERMEGVARYCDEVFFKSKRMHRHLLRRG